MLLARLRTLWHDPRNMSSYRRQDGRVIPQALSLVTQQLAYLFYPSVLTSSILFALRRHASIDLASRLPTWAVVISSLLSIPVFHIGKAKINDFVVARKADRMGAQMVPRWDGKSVGNVDLLVKLTNAATTGFLSEFHLVVRSWSAVTRVQATTYGRRCRL